MLIDLRGTTIYVDIVGSGLDASGPQMREKPVAMLVHGGPGLDHTGLKGEMDALSDRMQLVYFDHRGHGRSGRGDPDRYTLDENVEDMEALRRHLGLGQIVSIGTSYGGMVAQAHAARYPDAVSHLVLVVTAAEAGFIETARSILASRGTTLQQAQYDKLCAGGIDEEEDFIRYVRIMAPLYAHSHGSGSRRGGPDHTIYEAEPLNRAFRPDGFLRRLDLRPELPRITARTLIIAGRHDWICAPAFSEEIHRLIPGSELRIFEQSGHAIRQDEPDRLIETIARFVTGDAAASP
ncbi:alpha/beta fold hydrolase [Lichenicola sp.]|uniref:alpha/beta fold hydrolase n=1 Tax=Lichenicola sp. TaxID=2804529 RepID=UPI003B0054F2